MSHKTTDPQMEACIQACLDCHRTCLHTAMNHCLESGGRHTEPKHFRLMISCAEMCQASANLMLIGSDVHSKTCRVCSEICILCAESCEKVSGMEDCAKTCRACAEACGRMAA